MSKPEDKGITAGVKKAVDKFFNGIPEFLANTIGTRVLQFLLELGIQLAVKMHSNGTSVNRTIAFLQDQIDQLKREQDEANKPKPVEPQPQKEEHKEQQPTPVTVGSPFTQKPSK